MSLKPMALKGFKRTPYIDNALPVSSKVFAGWAQILFEHFSREHIKCIDNLAICSSFHPQSQDVGLSSYLSETKQVIPLNIGKHDGLNFWGVEALLSAWGLLQTDKFNELLIVGGQAFSHDEKLLFQKKDSFDGRLATQAELLAREMKFEREFLDQFKAEQLNLSKKSSSHGLYAHELLSVFIGEGVRKLVKTDQLPYRNVSYSELSSLPLLIDHLRGIVTDGTISPACSSLAMILLSSDPSSSDLVLSNYSLNSYQGESWGEFLLSCLKKWEVQSGPFSHYSRFEFVELSAPQSLIMRESLNKVGVETNLINQWGGCLGKGFCSPIEGLVSLGHFNSLKANEKGLLLVTHADGHLLLLEVGKF